MATSPERKKQKLDPFADLREYTAPSMSASYDRAKSEAELAEYKSLTVAAPAVDSVRGILEAEGRAVSDHVTDCKEAVVCFDQLNSVRAGFAVFVVFVNCDRNCNEKVLLAH